MREKEINKKYKLKPSISIFEFVSNFELFILRSPYFSWVFSKIVTLPSVRKFFISRRVSVESKAILKTQTGKVFLVGIQNLSKSGLLVALERHKTDFALEVGELVHVHFVLKPQLFVKCSATIVRQHTHNIDPQGAPYYGIKITHIDSNSKGRMVRFLEDA